MEITAFIPDWIKSIFRSRDGFVINTQMGQKGPVWIDVNKPYEMYTTIPQLKAVVDRRAAMYATGMPRLRNIETGEIIDDPEFSKLFNNPNPLQSMNDFLINGKQQKLVYGNQFIYKNKASSLSRYPASLFNIAPRYVQPDLTGKVFDQVDISKIIKGYIVEAAPGERKVYRTDEIIWSKATSIDDALFGESPIRSLKFPLSNIKQAYEFRNVVLGAPAGIGILSNEAGKDISGSIPMTPQQEKDLNEAFSETWGIGKGKRKIRITSAGVKWSPMGYPLKDMLTFEEIDADMMTICDAYGMNRYLFSSNTTYENLQSGIKQTYQDTIIPDADNDTQLWTKELGLPEGVEIFMDYSHVAILKKDATVDTNNFVKMVAAVAQAVEMKLCSISVGEKIIADLIERMNSQ